MEVSLKQLTGRCKGLYVAVPVDGVLVRRGDKWRRVGLIDRRDGANLRFVISSIPKDVREQIRQAVSELREEQGFTTGLITSAPIRRDKYEAIQKGEIKPKTKTIWMPGDG